MKRILAVFLSLFLVAMTAGEASWHTPAANPCGPPAGSCCSHSPAGRDQRSAAGSPCLRCCLMCCVMVEPHLLVVTAPDQASIVWRHEDLGAPPRSDKPPLPPPRLA